MTLKDALAQLKKLGNEKVRARNTKNGADDKQFGVQMGDIRKVAAKIKTDHELGLALWGSGNLDARLLACLVLIPRQLSADELDRMVRTARFAQLAEWLNSYVVREHPDKEALRIKWMKADERLPRLSGFEGLYVAVRPDLDQLHGEPGVSAPSSRSFFRSHAR